LCAAVPVDVTVFTEPALFSPPIADVRSPEFAIDVRLTTPFDNFAVAFGGRLPITTVHLGEHAIQLGLDGGVFSELGRASPGIYFPVYTADYLVAVPIMWRWRGLSAEFVASHISAHRVDGLPLADVPRGQFKYSREFFSARVSYDRKLGAFLLRAYFGGGYLARSAPWDIASPFYFGGGLEVSGPWIAHVLRPMAAVDVSWHGDSDSVDSSVEAGFWLFERTGAVAQVRATLGLYSGKERRGILLDERRERVAFGIHIRFADAPRP
jgi:hypothetical protein